MGWKAVFAGLIVLVYVATAGAVIYLAYVISPPTNADQYKEFGVRAGIGLTAVSAFFGVIVSLFVLSIQIRASQKLETYKGEIIENVEAKKGEIQAQLQALKGSIDRQNEFLDRTVDIKSTAYDKLFIASNNCYRELQKLSKGQFDKQTAADFEHSLHEAEGLAANLDDTDQKIVKSVVQFVLNIVDETEGIKVSGAGKKEAYVGIWTKYAQGFGAAVEDLRNRSLYHNKPTLIE